jgi:predicted nucleic acid-binding protein
MKKTLFDTSVWIDFFRSDSKVLDEALEEGTLILHPFIYGELTIGNFKNRQKVFSLLDNLPFCKPAHHNEVLHFINQNELYGTGVGWIDFHLLVAAKINDLKFFAKDKSLMKLANKY